MDKNYLLLNLQKARLDATVHRSINFETHQLQQSRTQIVIGHHIHNIFSQLSFYLKSELEQTEALMKSKVDIETYILRMSNYH